LGDENLGEAPYLEPNEEARVIMFQMLILNPTEWNDIGLMEFSRKRLKPMPTRTFLKGTMS
jgi:hypothetical protein